MNNTMADPVVTQPPRISVTAAGRDRVIVRVRGRLDRAGVARLRTVLAEARAVGVPSLLVDVSGTSGWNRGVARILAWARLQLAGQHQQLTVVGAPARLRDELDTAEQELGHLFWHGPRPSPHRNRPETAEQP